MIVKVKKILAEAYNSTGRRAQVLLATDIPDDVALFDFDATGRESLEFDSLDALEVAAMLEDQLAVVLPPDIDINDLATPLRIVALITRLA